MQSSALLSSGESPSPGQFVVMAARTKKKQRHVARYAVSLSTYPNQEVLGKDGAASFSRTVGYQIFDVNAVALLMKEEDACAN